MANASSSLAPNATKKKKIQSSIGFFPAGSAGVGSGSASGPCKNHAPAPSSQSNHPHNPFDAVARPWRDVHASDPGTWSGRRLLTRFRGGAPAARGALTRKEEEGTTVLHVVPSSSFRPLPTAGEVKLQRQLRARRNLSARGVLPPSPVIGRRGAGGDEGSRERSEPQDCLTCTNPLSSPPPRTAPGLRCIFAGSSSTRRDTMANVLNVQDLHKSFGPRTL